MALGVVVKGESAVLSESLDLSGDDDLKQNKKSKKKKYKKKKKKKIDKKEQSRFVKVFENPKPEKKSGNDNIFKNEFLEDDVDIFGSITMLSKVKKRKKKR